MIYDRLTCFFIYHAKQIWQIIHIISRITHHFQFFAQCSFSSTTGSCDQNRFFHFSQKYLIIVSAVFLGERLVLSITKLLFTGAEVVKSLALRKSLIIETSVSFRYFFLEATFTLFRRVFFFACKWTNSTFAPAFSKRRSKVFKYCGSDNPVGEL